MSFGHVDKIIGGGAARSERRIPAPPVGPEWYAQPELQPILTGHDIGALYRALNRAGVSQRRIATLTGTTQPQVADIITGRRTRVQAYDVLVRAAEGLVIPRERMGLSFWGPDGKWYGPQSAHPEGVTAARTTKGVSADMLRRHLIAWGGIVMAGSPVTNLGELLDELGDPPPLSPPTRLGHVHVAQISDLRQRLAEAGMAFGADPEMSSAAAARADRLLTIPGAEPITRAMRAAVAQLHIHAGRAAFDGGLYQRALHHLARALDLARQADDPYLQALALNWAGVATVEHGHPDDGLKILQGARVAAWTIPADHDRRAAVEACGLMGCTTALAMLGRTREADRHVGTARQLWAPTRTDTYGDLDLAPALLEIDRGRLDLAEQYAAASIHRWEGISRRARTHSRIVLATVHVRAGEQRGLQLAHDAITEATRLNSVRVRGRLAPLAVALQARPGSDARDLARMARHAAG